MRSVGELGVGAALNIDCVSWASPRTQFAANAFFQTIRVPVELVATVIPRLRGDFFEWVLFSNCGAEEGVEGDAKPCDRRKEFFIGPAGGIADS